MSKERELLKRVRDTLLELKETHYDLYWDIQTALDHPSVEDAKREDLREGITLRDHFAGLAMQGLLSSDINTKWDEDDIALISYGQADAMLERREEDS